MIKKIPKYFDGTQSIAAIKDPIKTKANESGNAALSAPLKQPDALTKHNAQQMSNALNKNYGTTPMQNVPEFMGLSINNTMLGAAASAAEPVAQAFGIEQGKAGQTIGAIGKAVGMVNPAIGAALQIAGATAGGRATLDRSKISSTSNINDAVSHNTGWIGGLMGADRDALLAQASGIQNSKMAAEQTANKQLEWTNDPRNQDMVFAAKDGGIVPRKVKAKISKGELYYNPRTKTLTRVPGSPDKPNTDDDITAFLEEGGIITPNSKKTLTINKKTQAQVFAPMIDKPKKKMSKGTIEARDLGIKNMAILNELTKPSNKQNHDVVYAADGEILEKFKAAIPYIQLGGSAIDALKKEKPETVRLSKPYHKSAPVYVNPYNQLQDIMLGQALSNYNISQSGYTGGQQLSAKIASASDFAKQRAKVHQWKEEQQNANIARNIAEYNNYLNILSDIENKEIDLNAANRAAADNINWQNRQAFYKNVGMYGRDYAGWDSNAALVAALQDLGEYGYSNWGEVVKQLKKLSKNGSKQIS